MTLRVPLVVNSGQIEQLQSVDLLTTGPFSGQVVVDFGVSQSDMASIVVTGQTWVTSASIIVAAPAVTTTDHPSSEEQLIEELTVTVSDLVVGVGFTVRVHAPNRTTGQYKINYVGT